MSFKITYLNRLLIVNIRSTKAKERKPKQKAIKVAKTVPLNGTNEMLTPKHRVCAGKLRNDF